MTKKIIITALAMFLIVVLVVPGCKKDTTVYIPLEPPAIAKAISFKTDLVPIFTKSCAISGCHITGGQAPDLTAQNAYNSLINGNFINKTTPESSVIYKKLTGALTPAMPLNAPGSNPSNIEGLIVAWIKQGAKNN